jgi:O-antigen/teichoic acid export membrane protein
VDIVLVQVLVGPVAAGAYALASKLLEASKIASWAFGRATLAVAARLSAQEPLRPALQPLLGLSVLQGLCVGAVLTLGGPDLLGLIFGSDVANAAAPVIRLMGLAAVMVSIASPLQNALLGLGAESVAMQASLWGLVTVVAAGVPMTYYFGMTGTIGAVLLSELCVLSLCARKVFRRSYSRS